MKWDKEMDTIKSRFEAQGNLSLSDLEVRFRSKMKNLKAFTDFKNENQGQHVASTVLYVPCSLDSESPFCLGSIEMTVQ